LTNKGSSLKFNEVLPKYSFGCLPAPSHDLQAIRAKVFWINLWLASGDYKDSPAAQTNLFGQQNVKVYLFNFCFTGGNHA
jgi:hypothetical protein